MSALSIEQQHAALLDDVPADLSEHSGHSDLAEHSEHPSDTERSRMPVWLADRARGHFMRGHEEGVEWDPRYELTGRDYRVYLDCLSARELQIEQCLTQMSCLTKLRQLEKRQTENVCLSGLWAWFWACTR